MTSASATVLPDSAGPVDVKRLANAFCHAKLLLTAGKLGLFAALEDLGPATEKELSERLGLHPRASRDFLYGLVLLGLLEKDGDRYANSAAARRSLVPGAPEYVGGFLARADRMLYPAWEQLSEAVTTGRPQAASAQGSFLDMLGDPVQRGPYLAMMDSANSAVAPHLAEAFPWAGHGTLVDVGGCRGNLASRLVQAHPHLTATVFDLPPMGDALREHTAALGTDDKVSFVPGDFFADAELPQGDVVMMGHVLHNWSPEQRAALVAKAWDAVRPGGALLVYDAMLDDEPTDLARILVSINMLLVTEGGSEYPASECRGWMEAAGCNDVEVLPLGTHDTLVVGRKPAA